MHSDVVALHGAGVPDMHAQFTVSKIPDQPHMRDCACPEREFQFQPSLFCHVESVTPALLLSANFLV
jgi:hypothetical protein